MIALMMFLFLSGGAKKAAPKVAHHAVCPDPNCTNPSPVMSSGEILGRVIYKADPPEWGTPTVDTGVYVPSGPYLQSADGSKAVVLSDSEYSHLQDLRKAVADEETRLAVKYGASIVLPYRRDDAAQMPMVTCDRVGGCPPPQSDHYEFHGQFLLIEKGSNSEK